MSHKLKNMQTIKGAKLGSASLIVPDRHLTGPKKTKELKQSQQRRQCQHINVDKDGNPVSQCITILSKYNLTDRCLAHQKFSIPRTRGRKEENHVIEIHVRNP